MFLRAIERSLLCILLLVAHGYAARIRHHINRLSNMVLPEKELPECPTIDHVCGRVWRREIYVQRLCACPGRTSCPVTWDSSSSAQSFQIKRNVQDKYCGPAKVERVCRPNEISFSVVSAIKPQREVYRQGIECLCKSPFGVYQNAVYELRDRNDLKYVHVFSCGKLPKCQKREPCAQYFTHIVNGRRTKDFVARFNLCSCHRSHHCGPRLIDDVSNNLVGPEEIPFDLHVCSAWRKGTNIQTYKYRLKFLKFWILNCGGGHTSSWR